MAGTETVPKHNGAVSSGARTGSIRSETKVWSSGRLPVTTEPSGCPMNWDHLPAGLLEDRYAACSQIVLVCDNLNTHTKGAFYERFEPQRARALVRRIVFCYTPKHGSWLNIAESELSAMTRQCLNGRRLGDFKTLCSEISAWSTDVNRRQRGVDWQMDIDDARCKLKSIYPDILM